MNGTQKIRIRCQRFARTPSVNLRIGTAKGDRPFSKVYKNATKKLLTKTIFNRKQKFESIMSRMDFFLDSGMIYGQLDDYRDNYRDASLAHLKKYPYEYHNYYAVKRITLIEVKSIRNRKRRSSVSG